MYRPSFLHPLFFLLITSNSHPFLSALADALTLLGIKPVYHMRDVRKNDHTEAWQVLLARKIDGGPINVEDFDAIIGEYAVLSLFPYPLSIPILFSLLSINPRIM